MAAARATLKKSSRMLLTTAKVIRISLCTFPYIWVMILNFVISLCLKIGKVNFLTMIRIDITLEIKARDISNFLFLANVSCSV